MKLFKRFDKTEIDSFPDDVMFVYGRLLTKNRGGFYFLFNSPNKHSGKYIDQEFNPQIGYVKNKYLITLVNISIYRKHNWKIYFAKVNVPVEN